MWLIIAIIVGVVIWKLAANNSNNHQTESVAKSEVELAGVPDTKKMSANQKREYIDTIYNKYKDNEALNKIKNELWTSDYFGLPEHSGNSKKTYDWEEDKFAGIFVYPDHIETRRKNFYYSTYGMDKMQGATMQEVGIYLGDSLREGIHYYMRPLVRRQSFGRVGISSQPTYYETPGGHLESVSSIERDWPDHYYLEGFRIYVSDERTAPEDYKKLKKW